MVQSLGIYDDCWEILAWYINFCILWKSVDPVPDGGAEARDDLRSDDPNNPIIDCIAKMDIAS